MRRLRLEVVLLHHYQPLRPLLLLYLRQQWSPLSEDSWCRECCSGMLGNVATSLVCQLGNRYLVHICHSLPAVWLVLWETGIGVHGLVHIYAKFTVVHFMPCGDHSDREPKFWNIQYKPISRDDCRCYSHRPIDRLLNISPWVPTRRQPYRHGCSGRRCESINPLIRQDRSARSPAEPSSPLACDDNVGKHWPRTYFWRQPYRHPSGCFLCLPAGCGLRLDFDPSA
jgi:hypothetical protein